MIKKSLGYNFLGDTKSQTTLKCVIGAKVSAVLLNRWILLVGVFVILPTKTLSKRWGCIEIAYSY